MYKEVSHHTSVPLLSSYQVPSHWTGEKGGPIRQNSTHSRSNTAEPTRRNLSWTPPPGEDEVVFSPVPHSFPFETWETFQVRRTVTQTRLIQTQHSFVICFTPIWWWVTRERKDQSKLCTQRERKTRKQTKQKNWWCVHTRGVNSVVILQQAGNLYVIIYTASSWHSCCIIFSSCGSLSSHDGGSST